MQRKRQVWELTLSYIPYWFKSKFTARHSPLVYHLNRHIRRNGMDATNDRRIRDYRNKWKQSTESFTGVHPYDSEKRIFCAASIARKEGISHAYGSLLYQLVAYFKPTHLLETGTSLGISSLYQLLAMPKSAHFKSIEGNKALHDRCKAAMQDMSLHGNVEWICGKIEDEIAGFVSQNDRFDWIFLDADHRYESTLSVVHSLLPLLNPGAVMVLDDIRWSDGMWHAWDELRKLPGVSHAIDFHRMGMLVFQPDTQRRDFYM